MGSDMKTVAKQLKRARKIWADARAEAKAVCIAAHADGMSELAISETLGVDRMTVRRWLGKRDNYGKTIPR